MKTEIREQERSIQRQVEAEMEGREAPGVWKASDWHRVRHEQWEECRADRRQAYRERRAAGSMCFITRHMEAGAPTGGELCAAWRLESQGWSRVDCVLDSGAADSVCPRSMAPQFAITETDASRAGVYYTAADGGRIANVGETTVPIALENGAQTSATFQVADVSRPLMSVGKACEMGNRVLFGSGGGYILNVSTGGATPFYKRDGVYIFTMWIPPASEAGSGFVRPQ